MSSDTFWSAFNNKDFTAAEQAMDELDSEAKQAILAALFQHSQNHIQPGSVSVLFRQLDDSHSFDDFYQAWHPAESRCNPIEEGGVTYQQFFQGPIRVINAKSYANPNEIVSIGLHWISDEALQTALNNPKVQEQGAERGDSIAEVAKKTHADIYKVMADDCLGTPF